MAAAIVRPYLVTRAVLLLLRAELPIKFGWNIPIGDAIAPSPDPSDAVMDLATGYLIVGRVPPGQYVSEAFGSPPGSMEVVRYQVTGHGVQRNQADEVADEAIETLLDLANPLPISGHNVIRRRKGGVIPADPGMGSIQIGGYVDLLVGLAA
jgi:hypothetical protein